MVVDDVEVRAPDLEARRVLARARYYRPDDAELWELSVVAADAPKEEEAMQRELVRLLKAAAKETATAP